MVYDSALRLYAYLQTGEILFFAQTGPAAIGAQAAFWCAGHLVPGMLCGLRRKRAWPDVGARANVRPVRSLELTAAVAMEAALADTLGQSRQAGGNRPQCRAYTKPPQRASLQ